MKQQDVIEKLKAMREHLETVARLYAKQFMLDVEKPMLELVTTVEMHAHALRTVVFVENLIRDLEGGNGFSGTTDPDSYYRMLEKMILETAP